MTLASLHAEDWPAISTLLDEALALPPAQRDAWLGALDGERAAWRERLRALLAHAASVETEDFLGALPPLRMTGDRLDAGGAQPGAEVGPYRLIEELGAGGMGAVWLAERADGSLRRKVALKLPRITWDPSFAQRSMRERDILAALEHPNIARLYDAGADALGRPYLAMEYVEGEPIDAYCDHHALTLAARVGLLLQVAEAVAYAHRRLVVHRDLKPSNILVNGAAQVRLLDFGIARLLADDGSPSAEATLAAPALTINYASPEQLQGQPLSTATDVYSLGVVAHELLCGVRPFDHLAARGLDRVPAILAAEPALPSSRLRDGEHDAERAAARGASPAALRRQLRGDLDAILLRALARRPEDRYPSVEALADDLARWRDGRPVAAQRPHAGYLLRKFIGRHRLAVAAGSAAAVALAATAAVAVVQGMHAREQAQRAQASRDFLVGLFERANPDLRGGRDATARELLEQGEADLARLPAEQRREVLQTTARLWVSFGDVARARQAQAAVSELVPAEGWPRVASRLEESRLAMLGWHTDEAERLLRAAEQAAPSALPARWPAELRARAAEQQGWVLYQRDRPAEAEPHFVAAREAARGLGSREGFALYGLAESQVDAGRWQAASSTLQEIRQLLEGASGPRLSEREQQELLAALTSGYFKMGRYVDGWKFAQQLVERAQAFYGGGAQQQWRYRLAWLQLALRLQQVDRVAEWLTRQADGPLTGIDPAEEIDWQVTVARVHASLGSIERSRLALARARALLSALPDNDRQSWAAAIDLAEAGAALSLGELARAANVLQKWTQAPAAPRWLQPPIDRLAGIAAFRLGQHAEAEKLLLRALDARITRSDLPHPDDLLGRLNLVLVSLRSGASTPDIETLSRRVAEALPVIVSAYGEAHPVSQLATRLHAVLASPGASASNATVLRLRTAAGLYLDQLVL